MVLAVGDIDKAVGIGSDVVHDVELAGIGAGLAPACHQFAIGRELVHARIAIAVGDVDLALRRQRGVGAAVEWIAAHEWRRFLGDADRQQHLAVCGALAHGVVAVIGAIEIVVGIDMQAVRAREQAFAPTAQEIAFAVQHDHRMGPAVEDVDAVLAVDRDRSDVGELPSVRQLCEVLNDAVAVLAGAENGWHGCSPLIRIGDARSSLHTVIASAAKQSKLSPRKNGLLRCARNDEEAQIAPASRPRTPSSIALIWSARYFELIRHCARLPAMNQRPGCPVRTYILRSSRPSPKPQIGPTRSATPSPNSFRTRYSCVL